ncbi:MAG: bifunctional phosphoribosylaminoimidazolecarboxamide formyltransferase/IMP cyclohydrolase PurH, partial [FCB group bacterium]|nr:bifunctional phosphoribosylaminoimidazolecarboxamide formyltransferase/IMP cyclohydrolase PurH [FCB group bacterium]
MIKIKRALISVSDKTGIVDLAKTLKELNCEIISTGGTKKILEDAGIKVTEISKVTGNPEAFGGRMKTISFNIESALLFDREKDMEEADKLGIKPIDLVVCNLYPFSKVKSSGADFETLIENIDIGGPTMVRAAAKNFKYVATLTDINDYAKIISELKTNEG